MVVENDPNWPPDVKSSSEYIQ